MSIEIGLIRSGRGVCAILLCAAAVCAYGQTVDGIVATVDTEVILHSDLMFEVGEYLHDLQTRVSPEEFEREADRILEEALQQAIDSRILVRQALLSGIQINDDALERRLDEYRNDAETMQFIESAGYTMSEVRAIVRRNMLARAIDHQKRTEFSKAVVVSESEVAQYFEDNKHEFVLPERVLLRQIFIPGGTSAEERDRARQQIDTIKAELDRGGDFLELARAYSSAPGADDGGIIGWIRRGDLQPVLDEAAFSTPVGTISGIIERAQGFHILRVDQREEAGQADLDDVRQEIEPLLRERAAEERFQRWLSDLRKRSRVMVFL